MLKVALGESSRIEGFITVDLFGDPDILWDLEWGLPFESNSVEYIKANQVVEHIRNIELFFREVYRVCVDGAIVHIETPHYESEESWRDITHVNHFSKQTPDFLCADNYLAKRNGWKFSLMNKEVHHWNLIFELKVVKQ